MNHVIVRLVQGGQSRDSQLIISTFCGYFLVDSRYVFQHFSFFLASFSRDS